MNINNEETDLLGQVCGCDSESVWAGPTLSPCAREVTRVHWFPTDYWTETWLRKAASDLLH